MVHGGVTCGIRVAWGVLGGSDIVLSRVPYGERSDVPWVNVGIAGG